MAGINSRAARSGSRRLGWTKGAICVRCCPPRTGCVLCVVCGVECELRQGVEVVGLQMNEAEAFGAAIYARPVAPPTKEGHTKSFLIW